MVINFYLRQFTQALLRIGTTFVSLTSEVCAAPLGWRTGGILWQSTPPPGCSMRETARTSGAIWWPSRPERRWTASSSTWRTSSQCLPTPSTGPLDWPHHTDTKVCLHRNMISLFLDHSQSVLECTEVTFISYIGHSPSC